MDVGGKIRAARQSLGMTQGDLGEKIGVSKSTVARYESGFVVNLKRSVIQKLADALGISPSELIGDGEKENPANDDEISSKRKELINFAMTVPEDKVSMFLRIAQSIVEDD